MTACSSPSSIPTHFDAIERMPVHTVFVHGQRIAYLDVGAGPPVILIHGFGGSMWQWEYQQHPLSQHFRVLTLDLPGAGLSDKPDIDYRPEQMLDFFVGFMEAVKIPQATLVGNSMGAGLAIGMALTHPARVAKLVLVDGLPQHVIEKLTSPSVRRALETRAPSWLVSFGNTLFGGLMIESVLQEIVHDPVTPHAGRPRAIQSQPSTPWTHQTYYGRQRKPSVMGVRICHAPQCDHPPDTGALGGRRSGFPNRRR